MDSALMCSEAQSTLKPCGKKEKEIYFGGTLALLQTYIRSVYFSKEKKKTPERRNCKKFSRLSS